LLEQAAATARQDNLPEAVRLLGRAKELLPSEPTAYQVTGYVFYHSHRTAEAAAEFKRAVELTGAPRKKQIVDAIGEATEQEASDEEKQLLQRAYEATEAGHPDQALPPLQRALDLNPFNARTRYEIGYAMIALGRINDAIPQLEEGRRINPVYPSLLNELQFCYGELKRYTEMRGVITDRLLAEGEQPGILHELGYVYAASGDNDVAIATLEENLRRFPDFYISHFPLGQLYCDVRKDAAKGRQHLAAFVAAVQNNPTRSASEERKAGGNGKTLTQLVEEARQLQSSCGR
jgi:tetratricopeptide (TPR) repeat protein